MSNSLIVKYFEFDICEIIPISNLDYYLHKIIFSFIDHIELARNNHFPA